MVCFVQLRNHLNVQRGHLLKAQQKSLLVRHQHKDAIIQNIAELQAVARHQPRQPATASDPEVTSERCETPRTNDQNGKSVAAVAEVDENLSSTLLRAETHKAGGTRSSQVSDIHKPKILKPNASMHRSFNSSGYSAENFGRRISPDVPLSVGQHATNSIEREHQQSSLLPPVPAVVKNISQVDACKVDYNSSASHLYVSSPMTVNDYSESSQPFNPLGTESGLPLVYMPPLTVAVTNTHVTLLNSQSRSPHYFDRLDVLSPSDSTAGSHSDVGTNGVSEELSHSKSLSLKKANCTFASKSLIANTYLSRRPPVFSPVLVGAQSDAVEGQSAVMNVDNSSTQSHQSAAAYTTKCAASPTARPSDSKQYSVAESSMSVVASPSVPPRLTENRGQYLSHSSLPELCEAFSSSVKPQTSQTVVAADTSSNAAISSSADSSEDVYAASPLTDVVALSNSSPAVVTCLSAFVPFHTSSTTSVSSATLLSPVYSPEVPIKGTHSPALPSSDLPAALSVGMSSEHILSGITYSGNVTAHVMPRVSALSSGVTSSFLDRFSSSQTPSHSYTNTVLPTQLTTVSASSEVSSISQPSSNKSLDLLSRLTVPHVCCTMPCTLTISTHIPVSSSGEDTMASLHTTLSEVVDDTVIAVSSSSDVMQSCSTTTAVDISNFLSLSPSHVVPSSDASSELIDTTGDEVSDHCVPPDIQSLLGAPLLCTSSPRMTRRRLSSDGAHASRTFSPSHSAVPKDTGDLSKQTNIVENKTAEEHAADVQVSAADSVTASSSEVESDASSDFVPLEGEPDPVPVVQTLVMKLKRKDGSKTLQRVSFNPLALLLDASLEGDMELVRSTAKKVS